MVHEVVDSHDALLNVFTVFDYIQVYECVASQYKAKMWEISVFLIIMCILFNVTN